VIVVARVSDYLSQSTRLEMLQPKTDEHLNPSVEVHYLVGKLSKAETLLTEVQLCKFCNQGNTLFSPCVIVHRSALVGMLDSVN